MYLVRCLARRLGKEVTELLALELGVDERQRSEASVLTALTDPLRSAVSFVCVGPYATPGVEVTEAECLSRLGCNWHHEVRTEAECIADQFQNNQPLGVECVGWFGACFRGFSWDFIGFRGCLHHFLVPAGSAVASRASARNRAAGADA